MTPERTKESKKTPTERNAELIIRRLNDYLSIRYDLASRINSHLRHIKEDLMYHEMANVRRCLLGDKIFGPTRLHVSDILMSDDERKRRSLMSPTDQSSIQVELVSHTQDERVEATRGQIRIHDLKSFYSAIDSGLTDMMDLFETWIWWDILDATELSRFEQKLGIITKAESEGLPEESRKRYGSLISSGSGEEEAGPSVSNKDVIRYEMQRLVEIRDRWVYRRDNEQGHMFVLKRDRLPPSDKGETVRLIAEKVREYDRIEAEEELSEEVGQRYAPELGVAPETISQKMVLDHLQNELYKAEREMLDQVESEARLGPPYNYKRRQIRQMDRWLSELKQKHGALLEDRPKTRSDATRGLSKSGGKKTEPQTGGLEAGFAEKAEGFLSDEY